MHFNTKVVEIIIEEDGSISGWCDNAFLFFTDREEQARKNTREYPENNGEELCG